MGPRLFVILDHIRNIWVVGHLFYHGSNIDTFGRFLPFLQPIDEIRPGVHRAPLIGRWHFEQIALQGFLLQSLKWRKRNFLNGAWNPVGITKVPPLLIRISRLANVVARAIGEVIAAIAGLCDIDINGDHSLRYVWISEGIQGRELAVVEPELEFVIYLGVV